MRTHKSLTVIPVLVLAMTCFSACGSDDESAGDEPEESTAQEESSEAGDASEDDAEEFVTDVAKCEFDETIQMVKVDAEITNESNDIQSYIVHVDVMDASGNRLTQVHSTVPDVAAGETVTTDGLAQLSGPAPDLTCEVSDVTVS